MLVITRRILDKFSEVCHTSFVDRSASFLRERYPAETIQYSSHQLTDLIEAGIVRARRYAIERECDVIRFLELMMISSPDFDDPARLSWPAPLLQCDEFSAPDKLDLVFDYLAHEEERAS
jgi:hypothetical protein